MAGRDQFAADLGGLARRSARLFTNYGPKAATFSVRRWGDTNDGLTVPYSIGGTASNGVDYVAIPGYVTIPAGGRSAVVTIMPIDMARRTSPTTVILALALRPTRRRIICLVTRSAPRPSSLTAAARRR